MPPFLVGPYMHDHKLPVDAARRDQRLTRDDRLRRTADFSQCYKRGRKLHGRLANLFSHGNQVARPRMGVTATRRVGNSVVRHRLRRQVKELYRRSAHRPVRKSMDVIFHLKPIARDASFAELSWEINRLLKKLDRSTKAP